MSLERSVVSLEIAKKLKESGFKQYRTTYQWVAVQYQGWELARAAEASDWNVNQEADAPTAQELADALPSNKSNKRLRIERWPEFWESGYASQKVWCSGDTMADALALLWLKLQEAS